MRVVDGPGARWFGTKEESGIDMVVSGTAAILAEAEKSPVADDELSVTGRMNEVG